MSEWRSCFFMGHKEEDERLLPRLRLVIDRLTWEDYVLYYYAGGHGSFDRIAANAVKREKQKHPHITLMLVLPYHPVKRTVPTPEGFDGTYHPEELENTPRRYTIVRTNQIMVNTCDWLVCYVNYGASNSRNLLEYARRQKENRPIRIIYIGENEADIQKARGSSSLLRNRGNEVFE